MSTTPPPQDPRAAACAPAQDANAAPDAGLAVSSSDRGATRRAGVPSSWGEADVIFETQQRVSYARRSTCCGAELAETEHVRYQHEGIVCSRCGAPAMCWAVVRIAGDGCERVVTSATVDAPEGRKLKHLGPKGVV